MRTSPMLLRPLGNKSIGASYLAQILSASSVYLIFAKTAYAVTGLSEKQVPVSIAKELSTPRPQIVHFKVALTNTLL